jgi:hypothetical protein
MMFLDNYYQYLSTLLLKNRDNAIILGWSYNNGFKYRIFRNRDITRNNYNNQTYNDYIELPYWYYELPFLIPAITHEVIEIAIRYDTNYDSFKLKNSYKEFEDIIDSFFENKSNKFVRYISDTLGYSWIKKEIARELFSDLIAYKIHKKAYLYTLIHNLLGEHISRDFIKVEYKKNGKEIKEYRIQPNDWIFTKKRDHNHLRLYFLYYLCEQDCKNCDDNCKEIKKLLNIIMNLDNTNNEETENGEDNFEDMFKSNFPNYYNTYEVVKIYLQQLYEEIKNFKHNSQEIENFVDKVKNTIDVDFNKLWKSRFDTINEDSYFVPYKGEFRKIIHTKFNDLDNLDNLNGKIKVLTLRKVRKDGVNKEYISNKALSKKLEAMQKNNNTGNKECWIAYGIYDFAILYQPQLKLKQAKISL